MSWRRDASAALGPLGFWVALGAVGLGIAAFATGLSGTGAPRIFGSLIASWLFFAELAAGAVAFRAFFRVVRAAWAQPLGSLAGGQTAFLPAASAVLVLIVASAGSARWIAEPTGWLSPAFLVVRQLALNAILFGLAFGWFRRRGQAGPPSLRASVAYLLLFAVVLSAWAFDFVLGPTPTFGSTLAGPYVFVSAFVAGAGAVILLGVLGGMLSDKQRLDASGLVLTLSIFWAYLFWSQYLTIWYANLPDEVEFALRRSVGGWNLIVLAVILLVFLVPFLGLMRPGGRRSSRVLVTVLIAQLFGLWLNCVLMVVPSLGVPGVAPIGVRDLCVALGMLGAFVLSVAPSFRLKGPLAA